MYDKKLAMYYILDILKEYSDKDHLLTQKNIIDKLHNIYQIDIERKTISSNLDILIDLGYDIYKNKTGVYLNERDFDETQIRYLIDAVYSSKIITASQAKEISKKLYSSLSRYQRKDYSYIYKSTEITRTNNQEFLFNIEIITEAIKNNKKIKFNYLIYDNKGNLIKRNNGYDYIVSPYFLVNNFGKYYLLANIDKYDDHINLRVDYISNIEITDDNIRPIEDITSLGKSFDINKHINDHVYMFGGNIITAKVLVKEDFSVTYIYDWFGSNAHLINEDDKLYAYIKTDDRALLYWLLQYIKFYTLIEPIDLKNKIIEILDNSIKAYKAV